MKLTPRFMIRAGLVLTAAGVVGAFGACSKDKGTPVEPPPPPPNAPAAPINVTATAKSATQIDVSWAAGSSNQDGFKIDACNGTGCTNFAEVGSVAANVTTFSNTGLAASTDYSYRVRAFNAAGSSDPSMTASAKTQPLTTPPPSGVVMVGAGEIASCNVGQSVQTAAIVDSVVKANSSAIVFTAGNNINDTLNTSASYSTCFDPTWGKFKDRMKAALGQQDFATVKSSSKPYDYFGAVAGADSGWYSFDPSPSWHVIVLNTTTWQWGANNLTGDTASKPHPMLDWLSNDLQANASKRCIMAISWERRFYTGAGATYMNSNMRTITHMLQSAGVDLIVSAKDKLYERFALQNYTGTADPNGIRQFIVGTGGRSLDAVPAGKPPTLEVIDNSTQGVLALSLDSASYSWKFLPIAGGKFTDSGTQACH